jgi:septal ring factor EnvC (AmiA/AmiB activator)
MNYPTKNIELYAKDEEITQLKAELSHELSTTQRLKSELMSSVEDSDKKDAEIDQLTFLNEEERQTIDDLAKLCTRAADALAYQLKFINEHCCDGYPKCSDLIDELRKAAE